MPNLRPSPQQIPHFPPGRPSPHGQRDISTWGGLLFCSKHPRAAHHQCKESLCSHQAMSHPYPSTVPSLPLITGTSCGERERLVLEGHFCWKVKKYPMDAEKSLDVRCKQGRGVARVLNLQRGDSHCQTKQSSKNQPEACLNWWIQKHLRSPGSGQPSQSVPAEYGR